MVIPVFSKHARPIMASLNNVVWAICQYNACLPWHLHTPAQDFCVTLEDATEAINQTFPKINLSPFVIYLQSDTQPDVLRLTCQDWDGPLMGTDITVPEIRDALGAYFNFEFAQQG